MRSSFPFSHPGSNGPFAGNQQTRPPPAAAAAAAASHASSWQPSALFFGGPVPSGSSHSTSMAMRSPAPMGFVLAAPLPTLPAANPMRPPPPPPRTNGFPSQISAEGEEDDSCSDSDSDGDPHSQSASNQARKQLRCKSQERGQRAPVRPVADARRSRDEFKSAPTSMHAHSQRPGGSNGASRNSSAHPPPVVASAAAAASSSSVPSAPAPPAPAAPSPFHFHRALPRIDLDQVSVPSGWTPRTADVIIIGAGAAGQQCAEMLSKLSPLRPTGAIPGSPSHSLSILMLEGRPRLGGRVFSEKWTEGGSSVVVEHGAAFIHGCDGGNLAFRMAVKCGMRRFIKNDFNDGWFRDGRRLDPDHVIALRQVLECIDTQMHREAKALLNRMTNKINKVKEERMSKVKMEVDEPAQERESPIDEAQAHAIKSETVAASVSPASSGFPSPGAFAAAASSVAVGSPVLKIEPALDPILEASASDSDDDSLSSSPDLAVKRENAAVAPERTVVKPEPNVADVKQPQAATHSSSDSDDSDSDSDAEAKQMDSMQPQFAVARAPAASSFAATFSDMPSLERPLGGSVTSNKPAPVLPKPSVGSSALCSNCSSSSTSSSSTSSSSSSSSDCSDREASKSPRFHASPHARKRKAESPTSAASNPSAIELVSPSPPRSPRRPAAKRRHVPSDSENEAPEDEDMQTAAAVVAGLAYSSRPVASANGRPRPRASLQLGSSCPPSAPLDSDDDEHEWKPTPHDGTSESEKASDHSDSDVEMRRSKHTRRARREKEKHAHFTQSSRGPLNTTPHTSGTPAKPYLFDPELDRSMLEVFEQALDEYKQKHELSEEDEQIVRNMATSQWGYVGELSKLSASDIHFSCGATGGERSFVGGFQSVLSKLLHRCIRRSKLDQCYFQLLHERTVTVIEQPNWTERADGALPLVVCYVPDRQEVYVSHFVVSTASVGIMQASIQRNVELAAKGANQLGKVAELWQRSYRLPTDRTSAASGGSSSTSSASPREWSENQLKAALVFVPPLSDLKVEAFSRMGMGCENKVIMQFAPGDRFWPRSLHVLRGTGDKQWRFYSLGGIRGDDCNVLVAHQPPPRSVEMESQSDQKILSEVMDMLREMFGDGQQQRNVQDDDNDRGTGTPRRYLPRSALVNGSYEWTLYDDSDDASDKVQSSSDDDDPSLSHRRQQHKAERGGFRDQEQIDDGVWKSKPVVPPIKFHVTHWSQDPYALGAYSFVPRGCQMSVMTKRLQDPEPPMGPDGSLAAAGGLYFAGEATSTLDSQQVHGAMKSGDLVAECIVKRIKRHMQRQS